MRKQKGITLIALIVTIIVLLILAGVAVATLTGDNGLISKSGEAKKQAEISEGQEQLEIAVTQSTNKRGNIDETKLAKNLSKLNGIKYINSEKEEVDITENTEIQLTAKVKLKGYNYKINNEGKVSFKKEGAIDNEDIMSNPSTYYGKYVTNYTTLSDAGIKDETGQLGKWQIFLADDTNIYLIANSTIHKDYAPLNYNGNGYTLNFTNVLGLYNTNTAGNPSVASLLRKLSKQDLYHEWLSKANLSNYSNQQAVLTMLDTDKWNEYKDGENKIRGYKNALYADYVIGGPTVEMFCESYNKTHEGLDVIPKPKEDNENGSYYTSGYKVQKGDTLSHAIGDLKVAEQTELNTGINNMHFRCNYWIASPGAGWNFHVMYVNFNGSIQSNGTSSTGIGFRPLVCLKSDVHLIEKTNGTTITYELELD